MTNDHASNLDPENALCLEIGRVARVHVQVDNHPRRVHQTLMTPGLGVYLTNNITSTDGLVKDCKLMLGKADVPGEVHDARQATLSDTKTANEERNRVVHDMWLRMLIEGEEEEPPRWNVLKIAKGELASGSDTPRRDLEYVVAVRRRLDAALSPGEQPVVGVVGHVAVHDGEQA